MKTESSHPTEVIEEATRLAQQMFEHHEAEQMSFNKFATFCIKNKISPKEAHRILIAVGYSQKKAENLKSQIKVVGEDQKASEGITNGETTFKQAYANAKATDMARAARKAYREDPRTETEMRKRYHTEVVRAIRSAKELGESKQDHLKYVDANWEIKK